MLKYTVLFVGKINYIFSFDFFLKSALKTAYTHVSLRQHKAPAFYIRHNGLFVAIREGTKRLKKLQSFTDTYQYETKYTNNIGNTDLALMSE